MCLEKGSQNDSVLLLKQGIVKTIEDFGLDYYEIVDEIDLTDFDNPDWFHVSLKYECAPINAKGSVGIICHRQLCERFDQGFVKEKSQRNLQTKHSELLGRFLSTVCVYYLSEFYGEIEKFKVSTPNVYIINSALVESFIDEMDSTVFVIDDDIYLIAYL